VEDAWLMLSALASRQEFVPLPSSIDRLRIAVARKGFFDELDATPAACVEQAIEVLRGLGAVVREVQVEVGVPWTDFDVEILDYHREMMTNSPELYQPATLERLKSCAAIPEAEFERAQRGLAAARQNAEKVFDKVDVVITPTCLVAAPKIADMEAMSITELRAFEVQKLLRNTAPFSLLFWPSASVPCGFTGEGLPVGLQISARPSADELALRVAHAYEQATDWHKRIPPIAA
jgi:aspartyl-tRNA(Asn)/glutamyl-tRNA(Gln) amidotransferase subunit A